MYGIWVVAFALQWVLLLVLTVLVAGMLRYLSNVQDRVDAFAPYVSRFDVGDRIANFTLPTLAGGSFAVEQMLRQGRSLVLLVVNPGCTSCKTVVMQLAELAGREGGFARSGWDAALVLTGARDDVEELVRANDGVIAPGVHLLTDFDGDLLQQYAIRHVPIGIAIDANGRVLSQSMNPHANWLYTVLDVLPPAAPIVATAGYESMVAPVGLDRVQAH